MITNKIKWIDLSFVILNIIVIFLVYIIDLIPPHIGYPLYSLIGTYFAFRMLEILIHKRSFGWISFSSFIINAIFSFCPVYFLLDTLIIPSMIMPVGMGFFRLYFPYEISMLYSLFIIPLTIVCCSKIIKYSKISKNDNIDLKNISCSEKIFTILNIIGFLAAYISIMPFHEFYGGNQYFYSCCLALTFATFNIIVGVVFLAKKRCLNNILNLFLKFYLILIDLYLIDNVILHYTRRDKTSEIIEHSNILVIVTYCIVGISILISILSIVYHFVVKNKQQKERTNKEIIDSINE